MERASAPLRVFVVDDHPVMRQGISVLLQQAGMSVVGTAARVAEALDGIPPAAPHVVLVDLGLGTENGRALLTQLTGTGGPRQLVYSMSEDAASIEGALSAGALGYVTKGEVWETLVTALEAVAAGNRYLSPRARRALDEAGGPAPATEAELSAREREVFRLLGDGFGRKEIAGRLEVSARTVESFCARLQEKLQLSGMRELRRRAISARRVGP